MKFMPSKPFALSLPLLVLLAACGGKDDGNKGTSKTDAAVSETRMDDIDSIEGTINDDMIDIDDSSQDAALAKDESESTADKGSITKEDVAADAEDGAGE